MFTLFQKKPLFARRTMARDLVLGLSLTVLVVVTLFGFSYQIVSSRHLSHEMQTRADRLIREVTDVLYFPLLHLDAQTIRHIANVYLERNDYITGISVSTGSGEIIVNSQPTQRSWILDREKILTENDRTIGAVTLFFTDSPLLASHHETIQTTFFLTLLIITVITICINIFMHFWLNRPFDQLILGIRRIASGDYDNPLPSPPQEELAAITHEVNTMARQIALKNEELARSEKKYRSIFNGAQEGIFQTTLEGKFLTANPAMAKIFGYESPRELIRQCADIPRQLYVDAEDRKQLLERLKKGEAVTRFTTRVYHRDGGILWVSISARGVPGPDGELRYIEGMLEDITEQKEMESNLRQAQKMEAIGTLAGGIAHDFNNILFAIFGYIELARVHNGKDKILCRHLDHAIEAAKRARDLVQQILTFSRKAVREKQPVRAADIVREALQLLRSTIPSTIEIRQEISSTATILADPTQIHQVVMNLCTNSYHAIGDSSGTVTVSLADVSISRDTAVTLFDLAPGQYILLEVRDTGCGMSRETRAKIFEPYFTTKEQGKGTGLGLAMVHGIVESYDGRILVHSQPGNGTLFRIYLPVWEGEAAEPAREIPQLTGNCHGQEHIMLVDDEPMIRMILKEYLSMCGYRVTTFTRGTEALAALNTDIETWDLIITDMTMPGMTGTELAAKVEELDAALPIILCTGYSTTLEQKEDMSPGIRACLQKPIAMEELAQCVRQVLDETITFPAAPIRPEPSSVCRAEV